jgi:hypothetical protein
MIVHQTYCQPDIGVEAEACFAAALIEATMEKQYVEIFNSALRDSRFTRVNLARAVRS